MERFRNGIGFLLENSLFLVGGTLCALLWANINFESYEHMKHALHFFVNDVGMVFFFGIATKEIREALLPGGSLNPISKATVPLLATFGGVFGPAVLYYGAAKVLDPSIAGGWAIPCATDIAFSYMFARMIFGSKSPVIPFLLLLAIVDDAAGLIILAVFYPTGDMNLFFFAIALAGAMWFNTAMFKWGVKSFWPYIVIGGGISWAAFYVGGFHPALALVPIIFTLPHEKRDEGLFQELEHDEHVAEEYRHHDALNEFEHFFKTPVELILGLFGLVNAGVPIAIASFNTATWLVLGGLLVGKTVFIPLCALVGIVLFKQDLPKGMQKRDLIVVGLLAAIGFTVSLFVSVVAFDEGPNLNGAKLGALLSFSAAGFALLAAKLLGVKKFEAAA